MSKATAQHPNASLTPRGRAAMVKLVTDQGWPVAAAAERYQVDPKTVRKWRDRYLAEGPDGLLDRSSRPRRSPARTPEQTAAEVRRLRVGYRWGPARLRLSDRAGGLDGSSDNHRRRAGPPRPGRPSRPTAAGGALPA